MSQRSREAVRVQDGGGMRAWQTAPGASRGSGGSAVVSTHLPCRAAWLASAASRWVGTFTARAAASPSPSQAAGAAWAAQLITLQGGVQECR